MALKEILTTAPVLLYQDFYIPLTLYSDASGSSAAFNLTQIQNG